MEIEKHEKGEGKGGRIRRQDKEAGFRVVYHEQFIAIVSFDT